MLATEILDLNYLTYVSLLGTAHFTRRSLIEAYQAVERTRPTDLALELDETRFRLLNARCDSCAKRSDCTLKCEFIGAADALGNVDANIWLIDMSEREIQYRIKELLPRRQEFRFAFATVPTGFIRAFPDDVRLWEKGYKEEVLNRHSRRLQFLRARAPHVWQVLIDERNALMAARLAWIVTRKLADGEEVEVLALTGAAHTKGIENLLGEPTRIKEELQRLRLRYTLPKLIRRVSVN
jgi:pheromone shutdown protein TraB